MPILITEADLRRAFPRARDSYIAAILDERDFLARHGILDEPLTWCHFCAQIGAETGGLRIVRENMRYSAERIVEIFGPRRHSAKIGRREAQRLADNAEALAERVYGLGNPSMAKRLGNTEPGDGYAYRGWGPGQVTGKGQTLRYGSDLGLDLEAHPELLEDPRIGLKAFVLEWDHRDLNVWARRNDIIAVSRGVNLGSPSHRATPNGFSHRKQWFARAWAVWRWAGSVASQSDVPSSSPVVGSVCPAPPPIVFSGGATHSLLRMGDEGAQVLEVQERLVALGYPMGAVDGIFGPLTRRAVVAFQIEHSIAADGIVGPETREAMRHADPVPPPTARSEITSLDGSKTIAAAASVSTAAKTTTLLGSMTLGSSLTMPNEVAAIPQWIASVRETAAGFSSALAWLLSPPGMLTLCGVVLAVVGYKVWRWAEGIKAARLADARSGTHLGR